MKGLRKKVVALAAVAAMAVTSLVGCAGSASVDNNAVVATVGDRELKAGVANFYARYQQAMYESYFSAMMGESMWSMEISEGVTYEETVKEGVVDTLIQCYILEDHMEEYNVSISDDEMAAIEAVADAFASANEDGMKYVSGDKENVVELLRVFTISKKMETAMTADVSTEVSDEEAAQKRLRYARFETSVITDYEQVLEMTEDEIAAQKQKAEDFRTAVMAHGDLEAYCEEQEIESFTFTFDAESTVAPEEVIAAADALGEGEFSEVIESEAGFYVIQLTDLLDEEATENAKESVVVERKAERMEEIYSAWEEETEIEINEDVLAKISFEDLMVIQKVEETEGTTEE